jgi:hypothetical protein
MRAGGIVAIETPICFNRRGIGSQWRKLFSKRLADIFASRIHQWTPYRDSLPVHQKQQVAAGRQQHPTPVPQVGTD